MLISLPIKNVDSFELSLIETGLRGQILGPFITDFESANYACGNLDKEHLTRLKLVSPTMKVINNA